MYRYIVRFISGAGIIGKYNTREEAEKRKNSYEKPERIEIIDKKPNT